MAKSQAHQIPKGFYAMDTRIAKKAWEGHLTVGEEYTIVDIHGGNYAFIDDNGEIAWVDSYGGYFK